MDEIRPFFQYLGEDSRLSSADEWWIFLGCADELAGLKYALFDALSWEQCPRPVLHWIKEGLYPLTKEGLLEWVEDGENG